MAVRFIRARPNLVVSDIPRAIAHYRDVLGFQVVATIEDPPETFALMMRDGAELALAKGVNPTSSAFYAYIEGVDELYESLMAAGAKIISPLTTHPWGLRDFAVEDPDGHFVALGERIGPAPHWAAP